MQDVYEFFSPFAHIPGDLEWCRVRSPTHGVFDLCIRLGATTAEPADVYVHEAAARRFMAERYPECRTHEATSLRLTESDAGRRLACVLTAREGPLQAAYMVFTTDSDVPVQRPYGGDGHPVWGSRFTCWGIDLEWPAAVTGRINDGAERWLDDEPAVLTAGSFGRITPRAVD